MKTLFCAIVLSVGGLLVQTALGCSCPTVGQSVPGVIDPAVERANLRRYYRNEFRGALFTGTVVKIEEVGGEWKKKVMVEVDKYWLGAVHPTMVVYTGLSGADCGADFEVGQQYLFTSHFYGRQLLSMLCDYNSEDSRLPDGKAAAKLDEVLGKAKRFSPKLKN